MNLRTITFWALYDPKRKEIVRMARFKKMFTRYSQAFVLVKLKGHYVKGAATMGEAKRIGTPKQRVLRKFRNAYACQGPHGLWAVFGSRFGGPSLYLSSPRKTAAQAWDDASRRGKS